MRIFKLRILSFISTTAGIGGILAVIIGGSACFGGLAAIGTIKLGKILAPNRPIYQKMILYGGISVWSGFFLGGTCAACAQIGKRLADEESRRIINEEIKTHQQRYPTCSGCKHFHGTEYNGVMFVCGMHPYGVSEDKCPDWEQ